MSGRCIEKLPHKTDVCNSSDGLQVFENADGTYTGFCFACNTFVSDPYNGGKPSENLAKYSIDHDKWFKEILSLKTFEVKQRALIEETLQHFGVKVALNQEDGKTPVVMYFPFTKNNAVVRYKAKLLPEKRMWWIGNKSDVDMFGWEQAVASGSRKLFITEGEPDACALYQALRLRNAGTKWEGNIPAVVSLTNGSSGVKGDFNRHFQEIRTRFDQIVLAFDQDEAGRKAVQEAMQIFPSALSATLPAKDANDAVLQGKSAALAISVLFRSNTPKNTRLVWGASLHEAGRQQAQWGLEWPWEGLTQLTRGMRFGETYYLGAGVKMGKSEIVNTLAADLIMRHKLKVFLAKPEETNKKSYQMVVGKVAGRIFHDPTIPFDYEAYDAASARVGDNLCLLNLYQHLGWDSLRSDIMASVEQGCKAVFIDPITNLTNGVSSGETNTLLQDVAQQLAAIAKDLELLVFIFCHLKAPDSGPAHERGGKVLSHQFSGSRAMMRSCNMMLGLEGNKDPDLPAEERNIRKLVILEDREFGASGNVKLYWDPKTGLFNEMREE